MCFKKRICVYTPRRSETCNKDKGYCTKNCRCTSYKSTRTLKSGAHLCASLEKTTCGHPLWGFWWASVHYRSPRSWLLLIPQAQRYFLTFRFGVPRAVRCTWTTWHWKLVHSPYQHLSAPCLRNYGIGMNELFLSIPHKSPRAYQEFSTFVRWLSYVDTAWLAESANNSSSGVPEDHRSHRAWLSTSLLDAVTG